MTADISANEIAPSINLAAGPAGFNIRREIEGTPTIGPGGIIAVQTKVNEADKKAAHEQNNRGNEKFANKHQKQVPIRQYSRLPAMAERTLAAREQFNRLYAKYAPTLSRQAQTRQNAFERKKGKQWGATDHAIRVSLTNVLTSGFGCLSQGTRDQLTQRAMLTGAQSAPDGSFIDRRQPQQAAVAATAQAPQPALQPSPRVGMDRRRQPSPGMATTPGGIQANSLQAALDRWGRSSVPLLGYDSSLSMRRS